MGVRTWFSADLHFGHEAVLRHSARPFADVEEMNESLIETWNRTVDERDSVYIVGDVEFLSGKPVSYWLARLNGRIWVARGNHDVPTQLKEAAEAGVIVGWGHVRYLRERRRRFWLSHYPHLSWENSGRGAFHLYGHHHGDYSNLLREASRRYRMMDVGIDAVARLLTGVNISPAPEDYRPISFEEVVERLEPRETNDHHRRER